MHSYSIAAAYMPETDTSASPPLSITPLATTLTPPPSASLSPRASLPPSTSPSISAPDEMNWYANGTEHSSATSSQHITTHSSSTSPITPPPAKKRARTPPIDSVHETAIQAIVPLNHKDNNSKAAKHQLSDRQRRQRLRNKLSELGELLASDHHLQRSDQMSILCCSVDTLRALRAQLMQTQNMLRTREAEARIYEAEHTRLQQAHSTMLTMIQTLQSHSATSTHSIPSTIPLHSQALLPAMSGLGVSIHRCHADGTLFSVSDIFCLLTGYSESELLGRNIFGYPLYSSVYIVPTALLQPFSQLPVLDKQSDASLYEVAVLNDTSELIRLKAIDDQALAATALPATQHNIHSSVSPLLLSTEHAHTLAHAANFNPPLSITSALFCSPLLQLKSCQLLKGADYTTGPNIASAQQQAQVIQRSLVGEEFVRMLLSSPPNHCMKLLQRMQTKTGAVYEAIITITCARNEQGGLHHFVVSETERTNSNVICDTK